MQWLMGTLLICGLWMFVACASDDIPVAMPTEQLQDGEWTGSGEGRSGAIIVKVTVEKHQVTKVTVVSQSESSFAQETINSLCESAVGRTAEMSVEVDGITGDEMDTRDVVSAAILKQTQGEAFLIFDQGVRKSLASIENYANQHLLKEGVTVAELAKATSIPAADLEATLNRYNAQQKAGTDEDFGRSAAQMTAALETAPYYAVCVTPAIHHTMGGNGVADIVVNGRLRVLPQRRKF